MFSSLLQARVSIHTPFLSSRKVVFSFLLPIRKRKYVYKNIKKTRLRPSLLDGAHIKAEISTVHIVGVIGTLSRD